jgi:hypothetical protein
MSPVKQIFPGASYNGIDQSRNAAKSFENAPLAPVSVLKNMNAKP